MHVCIYTCRYVFVCPCVYVCMHMCACMCVRVCVCMCVHIHCEYTCRCKCMHVIVCGGWKTTLVLIFMFRSVFRLSFILFHAAYTRLTGLRTSGGAHIPTGGGLSQTDPYKLIKEWHHLRKVRTCGFVVCHWGWVLRFQKPKPGPVSLLFLLPEDQDGNSQLLL